MTALRALAYADWRIFLNSLRRIRREPGRLSLWIVYGLMIGLFMFSRTHRAPPGHAHEDGPSDLQRADYIVCTLLVFLTSAIAFGRGATGIFRTRAEARFIIGSPVAAPLAIAYLQLRDIVAQGGRSTFSLLYLVIFLGPRDRSATGIAIDIVILLAMMCATAAVAMPRRLLPPAAARVCAIVGIPLILAAFVPIVRDTADWLAFGPALGRDVVQRLLPAWHPGLVILEPSAIWLLAALAIVAAAVAMLAAVGRDGYPELYALSIARIDLTLNVRSRMRDGLTARPAIRRTARIVAIPAPPGVMIFMWKSLVEFRRRVAPRNIGLGMLLWCALGFGFARGARSDGDNALFTAVVSVIVMLMFVIATAGVGALATEMRRPLFWLSQTALFERLCALACSRSWRTVVTLELVALGFALGGGGATKTLVLAVGLPALVALLAGTAFVSFALFPRAADARGPVFLLRLIASMLAMLPPLVLALVASFVIAVPVAGLFAATMLALIEAGGLIGIAAWRLDGRTDRLAV